MNNKRLADYLTDLDGVTLVVEGAMAAGVAVDFLVHFQTGKRLAVIYLAAGEPELAMLRSDLEMLTAADFHTLFVVDADMMPCAGIVTDLPSWLLGLNALYMGRVYTYSASNAVTFTAAHFSYISSNERRVSYMPLALHHAAFARIHFEDTDCWGRQFPGRHKLGLFNDRPWWKGQNEQEAPRQEQPRQERRQREQPRQEAPRRGQFQGYDTFEEYLRATFGNFRAQDHSTAWWNEFWRETYGSTATPRTATQTAYEVLGVSPSATGSEIKAAYRKLAREWHPDVNKSPDATARMQEINQAYEDLGSPK